MTARTVLLCAALLMSREGSDAGTLRRQRADTPKSPVVLAVGCARPGVKPNIWVLLHVAERSEALRPGITTEEKERLALRPLGENTYELIGVADFVDADTSRTIGVRGEILPRARVNATGMLASGHRVGVKGLFIQGSPPRINLTSVVDLAPRCP